MANPSGTQATRRWTDDGTDVPLEFDMDDEIFFDASADEIQQIEDGEVKSLDGLAPWRLVEIAKEDRYLKAALADFEEYDKFEYFGDDLTAGYSP